jgi:hypothetical protein
MKFISCCCMMMGLQHKLQQIATLTFKNKLAWPPTYLRQANDSVHSNCNDLSTNPLPPGDFHFHCCALDLWNESINCRFCLMTLFLPFSCALVCRWTKDLLHR